MNNKFIKYIAIASAILLTIVLVASMTSAFNNMDNEILSAFLQSVLEGLVALFGVVYVLFECKKGSGSRMLKLYFAFFAGLQYVFLFRIASDSAVLQIMLIALSFAATCILAVANDLGELKSKILSAVGIVCNLISAILMISDTDGIFAILGLFSRPVIAISCFILICAKYEDKKSRGSK